MWAGKNKVPSIKPDVRRADVRSRGATLWADPEADSKCILQAKAGQSEAFDRLVRLHQEDLRRFVSCRIPAPDDVADLCQDVLVRAYLKLNQFNGRSTFRTWLLAIARRAVADFYRADHSRAFGAPAGADGEACARNQEPFRILRDRVAEVCEARQRIGRCLACVTEHLPLDEQVAVILCDIYGFNDREAARILGKSLGAFKHRLHRARTSMDRVSQAACVLVRKTGDATACGAHEELHERLGPTAIPGSAGATRDRRQSLNALRDELVREVESLFEDHFCPSSRLIQRKVSGRGPSTGARGPARRQRAANKPEKRGNYGRANTRGPTVQTVAAGRSSRALGD